MEEQEEMLNLILGRKEEKYGKRKSTLQMALSVARYLCCYNKGEDYSYSSFSKNRYIITEPTSEGVVSRPTYEEADVLVAILLYLIALEQIGELFIEPQSGNGNDPNGIAEALYKYSVLKDDENGSKADKIDAIKHLRHSLAHNFGLASDKQSQKYKYKLTFDNENKYIIKLSDKKWNGDCTVKSDETSTKIHPINLIKEIERIISAIQSDKEVEFLKNKDLDEVKTKYTIILEQK